MMSLMFFVVAVGSTASLDESPPSIWRTINMCPVNCAYMILKLENFDVPYEVVSSTFSTNYHGNSIKEIRDFLTSKGFDAVVLKATPEYLSKCRLPAIAHCEEVGRDTGHYVLITGASRDQVEIIDGTTASISTQSMEEFSKSWTGFLLVRRESAAWRYLIPTASGFLALGILALKSRITRR